VRARRAGAGGSVLIMVMILSMALGFAVMVLLQQAQVDAQATRVRMGSIRALYEAYAELENAKTLIGSANYDTEGNNLAVLDALSQGDHKLPGTGVVIEPLTGNSGTWFSMTATVPYDGVYERVVTQTFRAIDFFSSYNLFVANDPAGISGSPVGAIHSNKEVQFYFPGGVYRHSVTAAGGATYKAGATPENTTMSGPFNPSVARIDIDYEGSDRYSLNFIQSNVDPSVSFDDSQDTRLRLFIQGGEQWVAVERWTKPQINTVTENVLVAYNYVNPHEETYTYTERVSAGFETRTRDIQVFDHNETVYDAVENPVYVSDVRTVQDPVYRTETRTRDIPIYRTDTLYRTVTRNVWVPVTDATGGTTVAGDTGQLGYWAPQEFQEAYTVNVLDHYETQTYTVSVLDHYNDRQVTYQRLDHYETIHVPREVAVYRTETETYEEEIFQDEERTATHTVYDPVPIYEARTKSIKITGDLIYKDAEGDTAYLNGKAPWLPYEPNPAYKNRAALGIIALNDIIYSRSVPDNFEVNASMLAITGRVGIDGIVLDEDGEVIAFNEMKDQWGRPFSATFQRNSIRRLGGITSARRPVETVVMDGSIKSGFNIGQSSFDVGLVEGPPPFFLAYPRPRFFATSIVK
jgi:hypothetical protein